MKKTKKQLQELAWKNFSTYVKRSAMNWRKKVSCYTCDKVMDAEINPEEIHAGHFKHGKEKEFYYDLRNCKPQCRQCNYYGGDRVIKQYTLKLIREYGIDTVERLEHSRDKYWSYKDLEYIAKKFDILLKQLP